MSLLKGRKISLENLPRRAFLATLAQMTGFLIAFNTAGATRPENAILCLELRSCFLRIPVSTATIIYAKEDN